MDNSIPVGLGSVDWLSQLAPALGTPPRAPGGSDALWHSLFTLRACPSGAPSLHLLLSKAPPSGEAGRKPGRAILRPSPPPDRPERSGKGNLVCVGGGISELGDLAVVLLLYGTNLEFQPKARTPPPPTHTHTAPPPSCRAQGWISGTLRSLKETQMWRLL